MSTAISRSSSSNFSKRERKHNEAENWCKIAIIALVIGITGYGLNKSKLLDNPNVSVAQTSDFTQQTQQQTVTPVQETKIGAIGTKNIPLKVSIVSFHGYAPGLLANGGLKTESGSINAQNGLNVEFLLQSR